MFVGSPTFSDIDCLSAHISNHVSKISRQPAKAAGRYGAAKYQKQKKISAVKHKTAGCNRIRWPEYSIQAKINTGSDRNHRTKPSYHLYIAYAVIGSADITAQECVGIHVGRCALRQNWLWRRWTAAGTNTTAANTRMLRTNTSTTCVHLYTINMKHNGSGRK